MNNIKSILAAAIVFAACLSFPLQADTGKKEPTGEQGKIAFKPLGDQSCVPERYRLKAHEFTYEMRLKREIPQAGVDVYELKYPSPVKCHFEENNTVYAEYYRPKEGGPFPAVIVLDILGGDQSVSRMQATALANNKI